MNRVCILYAPGDLRLDAASTEAPGPGEVRVRIGIGGICGSDLHYYRHGGFGAVRLREPMILGHEVSGTVEAAGDGASLAPGTKVALDPAQPCGACRFCAAGLANHCVDMRFYGSAMRMPHVQGAFRDRVTLPAGRCAVLSEATPLSVGAVAEPLAVCLHAANRAEAACGTLEGRTVLVTGAGPIGALTCAVARSRGASRIVARDLQAFPLEIARRMGATEVRGPDDDLSDLFDDEGQVDVAFECSGAALALGDAARAVRPGGAIVQVGMGGDGAAPMGAIVTKEITLTGSFRFTAEFRQAATLLDGGVIDPGPILTRRFGAADAVAAFEAAGDRQSAMKVQLDFS